MVSFFYFKGVYIFDSVFTLLFFFFFFLAYYAVRVFVQLIYGVCIPEPGTNACTFEMSQTEAKEFTERAQNLNLTLAVLRPPGSNTFGHGAPGH